MDLTSALAEKGIDPAVLLAQLRAELDRRRAENRLQDYRPYAKQALFHSLGATKRERLFRAGNQLGKTIAGGFETAMHLTGKYPDWWIGRRFDHPTVGWVAGVTAEATRDGCQRILLGRTGSLGTGTIPGKDIIGQPLSRQGVADAFALAKIRHVSGGTSVLIFKSYDQGREKWQGDTIDFLWPDEEPPEEIYTEGLTRTNAGDNGKGGIVYVTFTPLLGYSSVVNRFLKEKNDQRADVNMTIEEAEHYTPEQRAIIIASYPEHEREARTMGVPSSGSGRVFPLTQESITWEATPIPKHWRRIVGMDFGWDHPTTAVWLAYDPESDVIYVTDCYRKNKELPVIHAAAIKARGAKIPVAWPADGLQTDKGSGQQLAQQYRAQGLEMLPEPAKFLDGSNGVDAGITEMHERMKTGRLRVASHLADWFEEFRLYHREPKGPLSVPQIVKINDDLLDATRYGVMCLRFARVPQAATDAYSRRTSGASNNPWTA